MAGLGRSAERDFYPRSPCGERLEKVPADVYYQAFLSTLSLRRATVMDTLILANAMLFLSTLSLRRATSPQKSGVHEGINFYPRSPCGERLSDNC